MVQWPQLQPARTPAAVVKNRKSPSTRRRNKKRRQLYLESKRGGPTSGQAPQSFETHSKVTASDPRRVNQEVEEVEEGEENGEENREVYTGKALVTGTDDTTNFNASLNLDPRPTYLLTGGLSHTAREGALGQI